MFAHLSEPGTFLEGKIFINDLVSLSSTESAGSNLLELLGDKYTAVIELAEVDTITGIERKSLRQYLNPCSNNINELLSLNEDKLN